jgi:hypothetical protein
VAGVGPNARGGVVLDHLPVRWDSSDNFVIRDGPACLRCTRSSQGSAAVQLRRRASAFASRDRSTESGFGRTVAR